LSTGRTAASSEALAPNIFARREPLESYLDCRDFIGSSTLRRLAREPWAAPQSLPAQTFAGSLMGDALHAYLLEPERFAQRYLVLDPKTPQPTGLDESEAMAREWLSPRQYAGLHWAAKALEYGRHAWVWQSLQAGSKELSIYWSDAEGGRWKARPDCFADGLILELKTARDVRPQAFARERRRRGYDLQAAHYVDAVTRLTGVRPRFAFVVFELEPPRGLWVHELCEAELLQAAAELERVKRLLSKGVTETLDSAYGS
jgi:exodeoxyribonuclease VIII